MPAAPSDSDSGMKRVARPTDAGEGEREHRAGRIERRGGRHVVVRAGAR